MKLFRFLCLMGFCTVVLAQGVDQNLLVTSGIEAGVDKGDSLNRAIYYVGIPASNTGRVYFRIFDADMGGKFDEFEIPSETRYSLYGKGEIAWGILSLQDKIPSEKPLVNLILSKDKYFENRWRTIGDFSMDMGEPKDGYAYFQLVVDGIKGNGRNIYQLYVSAQDKENVPIKGVKISSPALSFRLSQKKELATQLKFVIPPETQYITVYNFDGDIKRIASLIHFESKYRYDVPVTVSDDASLASTQLPIQENERGQEAALVIEQNTRTNNTQFWIADDQGKIIELIYPPTIFTVNHLPVPKIDLVPLSECNSLILDASGSTDPDGDDLKFQWILNGNIQKSGSRIVYDFSQPGDYDVLLIVEDNSGYVANTSRLSKTIKINEAPTARIIAPERGIPFQDLFLDASSSVDQDGQILKYLWDFGDGYKAATVTAIHRYSQAGKYQVSLTVEDDGLSLCNRDRTTMMIWINAQPAAKLNQGKTIAAIAEVIQFDAEGSIDSDGELVRYHWGFGDGAEADGFEVSHTYAQPGTYQLSLEIFDDAEVENSTDLVTSQIIINDPPVPGFEFPPIVAAKEVRVFSAQASVDPDGEIVEYVWDFGDGFSRKGQVVDHQYAQPGTYTVKLWVRDNTPTLNNHAQIESKIRVNDPTTVDAGGSRRLNSSQVVLDGSGSTDSDDEIIDYFWDFGDNQSAHGKQLVHTYAYPGTYRVRLTTTDASGSITAKQYQEVDITINHPPIADAGLDRVIAPGESVKLDGGFSNDPDGKMVSYQWLVEEGVVIDGKTARHTFETPGMYQVQLKVTDDAGAEDIHYTTVFVNSSPTPVISPVDRLGPGQTYRFNAGLSYDVDGDVSQYEWDFGDNTAVATGKEVEHIYAEAGRYTITLTVRDNSSASNNTTSATQGVAVNYRPKAEAGSDILTCDQQVLFDGTRSSDPDGDLLSYYWDFGDGNSATGMQIVHIYKSTGIYPVVLRVDDGQGLSNSLNITNIKVHVNSPPVAIIAAGTDTICAGEPLMLDASKSYDFEKALLRYLWDFGDGGKAEGVNPIHAYKRGGDYPVRLTVYDDSNLPCDYSVADMLIHVIDAPVAEAGEDQTVCANTVVSFDGSLSSGGGRSIKSYGWDFGDGDLGGGVTPTHVYTRPGKFPVRLTIMVPEVGDCENTSEDELTVLVIAAPTASFTARSFGCIGDSIIFDATASDPGNSRIVRYDWNYGNGVTAEGIKTVYIYEKPGTYITRLKVTTESELGCNVSETERIITINDPPMAAIEVYASDAAPALADRYSTFVRTLLNFSAAKSADSDGFIRHFRWDFGDGNSATGITTQHQYDMPGEYQVALLVTDNSMTRCNTARKTMTLVVRELPQLAVEGPVAGFVNDPIAFEAVANELVKAKAVPYKWYFSDGAELEGAQVRKSFERAGKFQVQVKKGDVFSVAKDIVIDDIPLIKVPQQIEVDVKESFLLSSIISNPHQIPIALQWDLGNGTIIDQNVLTYAYSQAGKYTARLLVWYKQISFGQPKAFDIPVTVHATPVVHIQNTPETIYSGGARDEVTFEAVVDSYTGKLNFQWDFGDGASALGKIVKHQFAAPGVYEVQLMLGNARRTTSMRYVIKKKIEVEKRD